MNCTSFFRSTILLTIASLFAKLLGAVYRIPLTNILGAEGIGLYQLVFPLYSLLLVITSTGIPNALSKIISQKIALNKQKEIKGILFTSLLFFAFISLLVSILVFLFSSVFSSLQGNPLTTNIYQCIAPSIFFVSIISVFRGYFQGKQNMVPTSVSIIVEQVFKLIFGLLLAYLFLPKGIVYSVIGAVLGVTISEVFAVIVISIQYILDKKQLKNVSPNTYFQIEQQILNQTLKQKLISFSNRIKDLFTSIKQVLKVTIPIIMSSIILPLVIFIDSIMIVNLLKSVGFSTNLATDMYGILTGVVNSLINLPSVIAIAVATCTIPILSSYYAQKNTVELEKKAKLSIQIVLYISIPAFVTLLIIPEEIILFLYGSGLKNDGFNQIALASSLLKLGAISVVFIALIQILTTILQSIDKSKIPLINLTISCVIKIILTILLVLFSNLHIFGALTASVLCFLVAALLNLNAVNKMLSINFKLIKELLMPILASVFMGVLIKYVINALSILPQIMSLGISLLLGIIFYISCLFLCKILTFESLKKANQNI